MQFELLHFILEDCLNILQDSILGSLSIEA
jgi:hypothetical protein